jgi:type II secretory pathway component PulK
MAFDDMALDVLDAIGDWVDKDDDPSTLGVERDYYLSLQSPYEPRNGPLRTLGEIELIAGIWPKYFRGEDWNLDGRLDPNEDDGNRSFPPDEPDGMLDAGWSGHLTVYSVAGGATDSGEPRLWLKKADPKDIVERCGVSAAQAQAIKTTYGNNDTAQLTDLLYTPLQSNATSNPQQQQQQQGQQRPQGQQGQSQNQNQNAAQSVALTDDQIRSVLAECSVTNPKIRNPGKMNLNTVPEKFLRDLFQLLNLDDAVADEVLYLRDKPEGMLSLTDLKKIPGITPQDLRNIAQRFDVASNVFTVACRGRSAATGVEVEIVAVVDRSTIPVRILEYREQ